MSGSIVALTELAAWINRSGSRSVLRDTFENHWGWGGANKGDAISRLFSLMRRRYGRTLVVREDSERIHFTGGSPCPAKRGGRSRRT